MDFEESICTLRYASRAKFIKNHVRVNLETKKGLIESFEQEIAVLQQRVAEISLEESKNIKPVIIFNTTELTVSQIIDFKKI